MARRKLMTLIILLNPNLICFGQSILELKIDSLQQKKEVGFGGPEVLASFPGGSKSLLNYLSENLKYPELAINEKLEDTIVVKFQIDTIGHLTKIEIEKGKFEILNNEVLRVVKSMPNWKPAMNRNKPVESDFYLPINFHLDQKRKKVRKNKI